jgi:hypothetical protein
MNYELRLIDDLGNLVQRSARDGSLEEEVTVPFNAYGYRVEVRSQDGRYDRSRPYRLYVP